MPRTVRLCWGRAALTLLLGGFAASTPAMPLSLSPLLSEPETFGTLVRDAPPAPPASAISTAIAPLLPTLSPWQSPAAADPWQMSRWLRLVSPWATMRLSDPSLCFASWRQVLNVARLGKFVVPLRSDPGERTNIILAAQAIDDTTVAPGAVFSFNRIVGERTPDRGYRDGLMFSEGQLVRGTGGGICIVATGLYNAALHAGMGLLERHPHSGIVGYAPPGCDASIVYGSEDMQFQNTTDTPVVVKTDIRNDCVVVSLYGQTPPPGHAVSVKTTRLSYIHAPIVEQPDAALAPDAKPVVLQKPRLGFDVTIERVITQGDQVLRRETVVTEHRAPRPEILRVPVPPAPVVTAPPAPGATGPGLPNVLPTGGGDGQGQGVSASAHAGGFSVPDVPHDIYWPFLPSQEGTAAKPDGGAVAP